MKHKLAKNRRFLRIPCQEVFRFARRNQINALIWKERFLGEELIGRRPLIRAF